MGDQTTDREFWESIADQWIDRFCGEEQDPWATGFNLPAFMEMVPSPSGLTLDVGCGEGRVARLLEVHGHEVVGVDGSRSLAVVASQHGLPVSLTISSMVLMDVDDLAGHVAELARVTRKGGTLCMSILHPLRTAGFSMGDENRTFVVGDYFRPQLQRFKFMRNGEEAELRFWHRSISDYLMTLVDAGFSIEDLREPQPTAEFVEQHDAVVWSRVPMFLHVRAARR